MHYVIELDSKGYLPARNLAHAFDLLQRSTRQYPALDWKINRDLPAVMPGWTTRDWSRRLTLSWGSHELPVSALNLTEPFRLQAANTCSLIPDSSLACHTPKVIIASNPAVFIPAP